MTDVSPWSPVRDYFLERLMTHPALCPLYVCVCGLCVCVCLMTISVSDSLSSVTKRCFGCPARRPKRGVIEMHAGTRVATSFLPECQRRCCELGGYARGCTRQNVIGGAVRSASSSDAAAAPD